MIFSRELFFYLSKNYSFIYTGQSENLKGRFLESIITWSEMGQQTIQAKEVYYQRFLTHSLLKPQISIMSTLALQLGQHFMFQKFEQTMVNLIFDTMDLHYGMKLMRDLRF